MACQLIEHNDLIGVDAGQPIRGQTPDGIEPPGFGRVAQRIKTGSVQSRPGAPIIAVFDDELVPFRGNPLAQDLDLRADGSSRFLGFGGDARVDCYSHRCFLWATAISGDVRKISS
jgi:hypothetical protein